MYKSQSEAQVAQILAESKKFAREKLIELVKAGATAQILYSFVGTVSAIENADDIRRDNLEQFDDDEDD